VAFTIFVQQFKFRPEELSQTYAIMSLDGKSATSLGAIGGKRGQNKMPRRVHDVRD